MTTERRRLIKSAVVTFTILLAAALVIDLMRQRGWIEAGNEKIAFLPVVIVAVFAGAFIYRRLSK